MFPSSVIKKIRFRLKKPRQKSNPHARTEKKKANAVSKKDGKKKRNFDSDLKKTVPKKTAKKTSRNGVSKISGKKGKKKGQNGISKKNGGIKEERKAKKNRQRES